MGTYRGCTAVFHFSASYCRWLSGMIFPYIAEIQDIDAVVLVGLQLCYFVFQYVTAYCSIRSCMRSPAFT